VTANDTLEAAVEYFASRSHDAWRRDFLKANPDKRAAPRMRLRAGKMVDINQPWATLDPAAKKDNKAAAYDAHEAVTRYPNDREKAAAFVHQRWIKRNKADPNQPKALFKPYSALPKVEKDKDRAHVDRMQAALAAVAKQAKTAPAKKSAKKKAAKLAKPVKRLQLDADTSARLTAAAKRLSATLGRRVTAGELAHAGLQAMLAIYEAAPAKRAKKS
jgi:hypothetical protein